MTVLVLCPKHQDEHPIWGPTEYSFKSLYNYLENNKKDILLKDKFHDELAKEMQVQFTARKLNQGHLSRHRFTIPIEVLK